MKLSNIQSIYKAKCTGSISWPFCYVRIHVAMKQVLLLCSRSFESILDLMPCLYIRTSLLIPIYVRRISMSLSNPHLLPVQPGKLQHQTIIACSSFFSSTLRVCYLSNHHHNWGCQVLIISIFVIPVTLTLAINIFTNVFITQFYSYQSQTEVFYGALAVPR